MEVTQVIEIEGKVRSAIEKAGNLAQSEGRSDTGWTLAIKEELTKLGKQLGYKVRGAQPRSTPRDYFEDGWLWDLTWVDLRDGKDNYLLDLPLVVESEWSPDLESEIIWDFQKLLVSRARLRVMIISAARSHVVAQNVDRIGEAIRTYSASTTGDRYLVAVWNSDPAVMRFEFRSIVV